MDQQKYKVIVVEDEALIIKNVVKKIEQLELGFEVVETAKNGQAALEVIRDKLPDVIITDIRMPIMDGLQLLQQLYESDPTVRSVIISGYNDFEYAREAIKYNVTDYLLKPVDTEALYQCLFRLKIELDTEHASVAERAKVLKAAEGESIQDTIEKVKLFWGKIICMNSI